MAQIEFRENKTLKLINVLSYPMLIENLDKTYIKFENLLKAKNYEQIGPMITYTSRVKGVKDGKPIVDNQIMVQLKQDEVKVETPYKFEKEIKINNCIMARFNGNANNLQFATMKIQLYAYENNIELIGDTYVILVKQEEDNLLADVFMPIKAKKSQEEI